MIRIMKNGKKKRTMKNKRNTRRKSTKRNRKSRRVKRSINQYRKKQGGGPGDMYQMVSALKNLQLPEDPMIPVVKPDVIEILRNINPELANEDTATKCIEAFKDKYGDNWVAMIYQRLGRKLSETPLPSMEDYQPATIASDTDDL